MAEYFAGFHRVWGKHGKGGECHPHPPRKTMNTSQQNSDEGRLSTLIREARSESALPPRFHENVWRKIEQTEIRAKPASWIELLAGLLLKPGFALATATVVLATGTLLGSLNGQAQARQVAQERYVAAVAMPVVP